MAISISVLILVIGLISLLTLPVEQYPDIAPPTVYVSAQYTGADAEAVMNSVIMPLEESINGVENMMYITSTASNSGLAIIQVYFKQGTDPDMAAVNVQNRVAKAQGLLPAEVTKIGVSTQKRQTSFLQIGAMVCNDGRYDQTFLANYLDINVLPQIKRIEGVGDVMELGDTHTIRITQLHDVSYSLNTFYLGNNIDVQVIGQESLVITAISADQSTDLQETGLALHRAYTDFRNFGRK